jgi:hypothetical protein
METMETNAKFRDKIIPFTQNGMRMFQNVNEAVKHFQSIKQPRSRKSIVWLWQQSFEVNAGSVSVLVNDYKTDPDGLTKRIDKLMKSESQRKTFEKNMRIWIEKTQGINRIPTSDLNRIIAETKSLEP